MCDLKCGPHCDGGTEIELADGRKICTRCEPFAEGTAKKGPVAELPHFLPPPTTIVGSEPGHQIPGSKDDPRFFYAYWSA